MMLTDTLHPPAGINPLLVVAGNLPWSFMVAPVLVGALMLAAFALVWHRSCCAAWPNAGCHSAAGHREAVAVLSNATLRSWKARSVARWPIETMVVAGSCSCSS